MGLSDFHNCIAVASKMYAPESMKRRVNYKCMRKFDDESFAHDVGTVTFHVCNIFEDVDDISWAQHQLLMSVVHEYAPLKTTFASRNQVPYMNSELRQAINQRNMWSGKYFRNRSNKQYRAMYIKWRTKVVKLHKKSIKAYFRQRCDKQNGIKKFVKTIKPFLSEKIYNSCGNNIIFKEDNCMLSQSQDVADVFTKYFSSVAKYDGVPDGVDNLICREAIENKIRMMVSGWSKLKSLPQRNLISNAYQKIQSSNISNSLRVIQPLAMTVCLQNLSSFLDSSLRCHCASYSIDVLCHYNFQSIWNWRR